VDAEGPCLSREQSQLLVSEHADAPAHACSGLVREAQRGGFAAVPAPLLGQVTGERDMAPEIAGIASHPGVPVPDKET
jgi:hypothetical protein